MNNIPFESITEINNKINLIQLVSKEDYLNKVRQLKQHIQQGNIYEINYCMTFEAFNAKINPFDIYQKLNAISSTPYSSLAKFNKNWIISSSPELFLSKRKNALLTKPIKGTAKRSENKITDEENKNNLHQNLKEQTENIMIVDVCRNDFSKIAKRGSVTVPSKFNIESFKQVHQMESSVSCELNNDVTFDKIINATFPMASMTGAPKIKAMQLGDEFELYNRNAYSGTLGYINSNGDFDLNVLIRSIFYNEDKNYLSFTVGSAITALCDPEKEYEECLLKAKAMIQVLS